MFCVGPRRVYADSHRGKAWSLEEAEASSSPPGLWLVCLLCLHLHWGRAHLLTDEGVLDLEEPWKVEKGPGGHERREQ